MRREGIFAKAPRPDLIMLEMSLPKRGGCEIVAELQADDQLKRIPIVVMQTRETCPNLLEGKCFDVLEFMPKPLDAERFVSMVKSLHFSLLSGLIAGSMV